MRCEFSDVDRRLPALMETALFRAVQEAISNIAKHANAEQVLIQCGIEHDVLTIEIEDDGNGFELAAVTRPKDEGHGWGLLGHHRARRSPRRQGGHRHRARARACGWSSPCAFPRRRRVPKIRVMLADDHAIVREGVKALINMADDMEVVGEAADGREAIERAQALEPDVAVMDIAMPGLGGLEATIEIRKRCPRTRILVLSQYDDREYVRRFLKAGRLGVRAEEVRRLRSDGRDPLRAPRRARARPRRRP